MRWVRGGAGRLTAKRLRYAGLGPVMEAKSGPWGYRHGHEPQSCATLVCGAGAPCRSAKADLELMDRAVVFEAEVQRSFGERDAVKLGVGHAPTDSSGVFHQDLVPS